MRVVALFRVSTEKQASEGASLDAQQRAYRELAQKNGWTTVAEFRGSESATQASSDRRVLQQVLACVRDTEVDAIYVHEQSRLTRGDELEVAMLMRELQERHVKVIINGVVRDLASLDERFMMRIQSVVDRAESERIKERMSRGKREKAKRGLKTGGPAPYGYQNPLPGQPGRGKLQIVESEAVIVRRIFDLAAKGLGMPRIADALNEQGVPASRGGRWVKNSVKRVLMNPAHIGVSASGVWTAPKGSRKFRFNLKAPGAIVVENAHEPIIAREVWDAVHGRARVPRTHVPRLLTGLIHVNGTPFGCDRCAGVGYYRGPRGSRGLAWLEVDATDGAVWSAFVSLATGPEFVASLMEQAQNPQQAVLLGHEIDFAKEQLAKLQRRRERLIDMRAEGEIDKPTFIAKSDEATKAIEAAERQLAQYQAQAATLDATHAPRIVRAVQTLLAGRTRLTTDQRRAILRSIVRRIDITTAKTRTDFRRDERGRVLAGRSSPWAVQSVSFRLALPPGAAATEANVGEADRAGQLATTPWNCGQLAELVEPVRGGHLGTTEWNCGELAAPVEPVRAGQLGTTD